MCTSKLLYRVNCRKGLIQIINENRSSTHYHNESKSNDLDPDPPRHPTSDVLQLGDFLYHRKNSESPRKEISKTKSLILRKSTLLAIQLSKGDNDIGIPFDRINLAMFKTLPKPQANYV